MKRLFAALALALSLSSPAAALTIDYETVQGYKHAANNYGIGYRYDIGFIDDALRIDIDLMLYGATQGIEGLMTRWETGIESIWSTADRFAVPILFNVDWVTSAYDHAVRITEGYGRWNTGNWFTYRPNDDHERVAAHEFGHYLSMFDEYNGGATDPLTGLVNTGGLMHTIYGGTLDEYYSPFLSWYDDKLANYVGGSEDPAPVPEPSTVVLMLGGMFALVAWRKQRA